MRRNARFLIGFFLTITSMALALPAQQPLTAEDVMNIRICSDATISPDGKWIAYTVTVPRKADDESGPFYSELFLASSAMGTIRPFITGKINASSPQWSPDGSLIAFISRRGDQAAGQVWAIPFSGGEAVLFTQSDTDVLAFHWHPSGKKLVYVAATPASAREKELQKRGYGFIFFEENLKHRNLYMQDVTFGSPPAKSTRLTEGVTVWEFIFSPDGRTIAFAGSSRNLVDEEYMFKKVYLLDLASRKQTLLNDPQKKLGNFAFSPDGSKLAFTAALNKKDHDVSQAYWILLADKKTTDLTPANFHGHISWVGWKDNRTIVYLAGEGVWNSLNLQQLDRPWRQTILHSQDCGLIFAHPEYTSAFNHFVFIANSRETPGDLFYWSPALKTPKRLTMLNPWLKERNLARQDIFSYKARDSQIVEGILYYPLDFKPGQRCPLIVSVHGGPEARIANGWHTAYLNPAQVLAGKGYLVFLPNYRASTGYGIDFAMAGYEDPAGKEFDDIADGIAALVEKGLADPDRVGLGGGSYGGFAAAWFASYYTRLVRAVVMMVGISDLISKRGTTDIPWEEQLVHSGKKLEEMWDLALKRSPIYWTHQSKTAVLILGGAVDTRIDPTQSREFFRILKMNNHPAVRLVQYPGEGHGNRRQPGRNDVLLRHLQWYDWYVRDKKPLEGPMPPFDISDKYGLKLSTE